MPFFSMKMFQIMMTIKLLILKVQLIQEIYYKLMNNFFLSMKKFNLNVLVAIHPKSNLEEMSKNFSIERFSLAELKN